MMEKLEAPNGWLKTNIGDVYQVTGGGTPSTKVKEYWDGTIPWITSADIKGVRNISVERYISNEAVENSATNRVPAQTLLVVTRVGLGKIAITDREICFSQDLQGLIAPSDLIWPEYALHYLSFALQGLKFEGQGTTISGITKKQLKDTTLFLPPLNEQKRIVEKIDELLEKIEDGEKSLQKVIPYSNKALGLAGLLRLSVLKAAFSGKLVAQDPNDEPASVLLERIKTEKNCIQKKKRGAA